jgi:hypothetical protein
MFEDSIEEYFDCKGEDYSSNSFYGMSKDLNHDFYDISDNPFSFQKFPPEEEENGDDNCDIQYFQQGCTGNQNLNKPIENAITIENKKTKVTTTTNLAQKEQEEKNKIIVPNKIQEEKKAKSKEFLKKKRGRKNKEDNLQSVDDSAHTKKKEDNMMRKIKTNLIKFHVKLLNNSLKDKTQIFYKIDKSISENLKRDFNLELNDRTLEDIFSNTDMSGRYKNYSNKTLIQKIKAENKEKKTIELLNMKFIEVIYMIQDKYLGEYLQTIEIKENTNEKSIDQEYMKSLEELFFNYETWFKEKKGRNRESNAKN